MASDGDRASQYRHGAGPGVAAQLRRAGRVCQTGRPHVVGQRRPGRESLPTRSYTVSGWPPVMNADTMNCALLPPGWAAAVMSTVPATGGPAGSRSMMLLIWGS